MEGSALVLASATKEVHSEEALKKDRSECNQNGCSCCDAIAHHNLVDINEAPSLMLEHRCKGARLAIMRFYTNSAILYGM